MGERGADRLRRIYARRARRYDTTTRLQALLGFRDRAHHRTSVDLLDLRPGDTVADLGCGTGLNLGHLAAAVGPRGRVVAVDASPEMLEQARMRARRHGWTQVEWVRADLRDWTPPEPLDGAVATFVLQFLPEPDLLALLRRIREGMVDGGRFVTADLEVPRVLRPVVLGVAAPYGHTWGTLGRRPRRLVGEEFGAVRARRRFMGLVAIAVAQATNGPPVRGERRPPV